MDELAARRLRETGELPDEVVAKLKAQHLGVELRQWTSVEGDVVVCKAPSRGEYKRFLSLATDPGQRAMAPEALFLGCVVYPSSQEVAALLERRPALALNFGEKLVNWAGSNQELTEKKL